jgi:hypothetical protein
LIKKLLLKKILVRWDKCECFSHHRLQNEDLS